MEPEIICEWGTSGNVRFLNPEDVKVYDSEGNEIDTRCKCGKPGMLIIGKECSLFICHECCNRENHD